MRSAGAVIAASIGIALLAGPATGSPPTGPSHCGPKAIRATLVSFTAALDDGDLDALDELFAEKPDFQWYSTDAPGQRLFASGAKDRRSLIPYFEARHRKHDRFTLRAFQFNGNSGNYGNFQMWMRRRADGFRGGDWFKVLGKGAAVCDGNDVRFIVLTFGSAIRSRARS